MYCRSLKLAISLAILAFVPVSCNKEYNKGNHGNQVPKANAGEDITLTLTNNIPGPTSSNPDICIALKDTIQLDASSSSDPDGSIAFYQWLHLNKHPGNSGLSPVILNANQAKASILIDQPGDYWFSLTVTDNNGATDTDSIKISSNQPNAGVQILNPSYLGTMEESNVSDIVVAGNKLFIQYAVSNLRVTGNSELSTDRIKIFDFETKTWSDLTLPFQRYRVCMASSGNKVFFSGGVNFYPKDVILIYPKIDIYDIATGEWSNIELPGNFLPKASLAVDNRIIFSGIDFRFGYSENGNIIEILDLDTKRWTHTEMKRDRNFNNIVVAGNEVFFAGGIDEKLSESKVVEIYNLQTNSWRNSTLKSSSSNLKGIAFDKIIYWTNTFNRASKNNPIEAWDINSGNSEFICLGDGLNNIYKFNNQLLVSRNMSKYVSDALIYKNIELYKYDPFQNKWTIGRFPNDSKIIGGIGAIIGLPGQQRIIGVGYKEYPNAFIDFNWESELLDLEFWEISF